MGEEAQKAAEEPKTATESKVESTEPSVPPSIVLKVFMHCEGCANKLRKCLKGFEGVEDVKTDWKTDTVIVTGEKADPLKVLERLQKKSHRQVELVSPVPKPPADETKKVEEKEAKPEEKKEEAPPPVITVVLKVHMHCEACAQGIRKRILKMNEVESAEADLKKSEVSVKGTFTPPQLVEYINKKMGKKAIIIKQDPEPNKPQDDKKDKNTKAEKKDAGADEKKENKKPEKATGGEVPAKSEAAKPDATASGGEESQEKKVVDLRKNEFNSSNYETTLPRYAVESAYGYPAAPQIFSDENPNACVVM